MRNLSNVYFTAASNMSPNQIQELFSPIVPGHYVSNLVFTPSRNPQEAVFRAIEALRLSTQSAEKQPVVIPTGEILVAHG